MLTHTHSDHSYHYYNTSTASLPPSEPPEAGDTEAGDTEAGDTEACCSETQRHEAAHL